MADKRKRAVDDLQLLVDTLDSLQIHLRSTRGRYRKALQLLQKGESVEGSLEAAAAAETRESMTAALDRFEQVRHNSRMSLIAAGVEEGMSINRVGKTWGISRQLASRYVNQVRNGDVH